MTQSDVSPVVIDPSAPPVQSLDLAPTTQSGASAPTMQSVDLEQEIEKIHRLVGSLIRLAVGAAVVNVLCIIAAGIFVDALFAGKLVVIEAMLIFSAVCLGIAFGQKKIMHGLAQAEAIAEFARDQAFVDLNMVRDELVRLRKKLTREVDDGGYTAVGELLRTINPLVKMFIQKEKNIFRWGLFGWKVAQNAMAVIKQRSKAT